MDYLDLIDHVKHYKLKEPVFLNELENNVNQCLILENLLNIVDDDQKEIIHNELINIKIYDKIKTKVDNKLKHSKESIIVLKDITLNNSLIDYIVITPHGVVALDVKILIGDIEVNEDGVFYRLLKNVLGEVYNKVEILNPIIQNKYHVKNIAKLLNTDEVIKGFPIYSLLVVTNYNSEISIAFEQNEINKYIVELDNLNDKIDEVLQKSRYDIMDNPMFNIANIIMAKDSPKTYDFSKYFNVNTNEYDESLDNKYDNYITNPNEAIQVALKKFRSKKAKQLKRLSYNILTNKQLDILVFKQPTTKEEFMKCGFTEDKYNKYGEEITYIIVNKGKDILLKDAFPFEKKSKEKRLFVRIDDPKSLNEKLYKALRVYRYKKAEELHYKPYHIFNNLQLDSIIFYMPKTIEELSKISGFTEKKCKAYGEDIITLVKANS